MTTHSPRIGIVYVGDGWIAGTSANGGTIVAQDEDLMVLIGKVEELYPGDHSVHCLAEQAELYQEAIEAGR